MKILMIALSTLFIFSTASADNDGGMPNHYVPVRSHVVYGTTQLGAIEAANNKIEELRQDLKKGINSELIKAAEFHTGHTLWSCKSLELLSDELVPVAVYKVKAKKIMYKISLRIALIGCN